MRLAGALALLAVLTACGVDGPPQPVPGGIVLGGEGTIGVR